MPKLTTNFEQEKQCGRRNIPWFQYYHKVKVLTTVWYCHKYKIINQWKRIQSPAVPSHIWSKDFWQSGKIIQWRKDSIPPKRWWENLTSICQGMRLSSAQSLSRVWLFVALWAAARKTFLFITKSRTLLKLMSIELVMPSNRLILCWSLLFPSSIFPSIRVVSNEAALHIRWSKYWSFSFGISPSTKYSELIAFEMDSLDLPAVQGLSKVFFNTPV